MLCLTAHCCNQILLLPKTWQVIVQTVNMLAHCINCYCNWKSEVTKHSVLGKATKKQYSPEGQAMLVTKASTTMKFFTPWGFLTLTSE